MINIRKAKIVKIQLYGVQKKIIMQENFMKNYVDNYQERRNNLHFAIKDMMKWDICIKYSDC